MSTTAFEIRGPNKALFRTAAFAGSAIIWGSLGYLALSYVPKFEKAVEPPDIILEGVTPPKPLVILPPPPIEQPLAKHTPDTRPPDPVAATPTLSVRTPTPSRLNPLTGELPAAPAPQAPAIGSGEPFGTSTIPWVEPIPVTPSTIPEPIVAPAPLPKLVINPVRISGGNPLFPNRALDRGVSGEVTLSFTVSPSGTVENINVTGEHPSGYGFARAARDAIQSWTFQPQTIDGVPVAYPARYTISFKLED